MDTISKNLLILRVLIILMLIILISFHALYWLDPDSFAHLISSNEIIDKHGGFEKLTTEQHLMSFSVTSIPVGVLCWILVVIYRVTNQLTNKEWFHEHTESLCSSLGKALLIYTFVLILDETLLTLALTMNNPEGERTLMLSLSTEDIVILIPALLATICAKIMKLGRQQKEELQQIV